MSRGIEQSRKLAEARGVADSRRGQFAGARVWIRGRRSAVYCEGERTRISGMRMEIEFIDYVGSWGPLILGHAAPEVLSRRLWARRAMGPLWGFHAAEADLAELVISAFPHVQKVRFVSSGTEATMSAIRLARAYTKRKYIVKFEGCYHGHSDSLLVKAGSGVATLGIPGSAGVPEEFTQFTLACHSTM